MPELLIDVPLDKPAHLTSDAALVGAIKAAGGRAYVGFKPVAAARTLTSGRIPATSRAAVLEARRDLEAQGARIVRGFVNLPAVVVEIAPELAPAIKTLPFVNYIEPAASGRLQHSFPSQDTSWGVKLIRAHRLWPFNNGGSAWVTILDSGVDQHHLIDFGGDGPAGMNLVDCIYITDPSITSCYDDANHGTATASVVAAKSNTWGMVGVAYGLAGFASVKVCDFTGNCDQDDVAAGLDWAVSTGRSRHIVNMSLGFTTWTFTLLNAVSAAHNSGILLVAAAGNHLTGGGPTSVLYPAAFSQVIAVSGTLPGDVFALNFTCPGGGSPAGSNSGPEVELSAPFYATAGSGHMDYGVHCGTSFATPLVSATAALLWTKNPSWTRDQVRQRMRDRAVDLGPAGHDNQFGYGRIDAVRALYTVTVTMSGPSFITTGLKTWTANPSGGIAPYSFVWERREFCSSFWEVVGSGSSYSEQLQYGQPTFYLRVTATSSPLDEGASATKQVGGFMQC
jgi:subtilisin family serine protease